MTVVIVEVSNNKIFDFLTSNSCCSLIFVNGGSMTNATVYQGFHDDKTVEEHSTTMNPSNKLKATPNAVDLAMDLLLSRPENTGGNQPITNLKP